MICRPIEAARRMFTDSRCTQIAISYSMLLFIGIVEFLIHSAPSWLLFVIAYITDVDSTAEAKQFFRMNSFRYVTDIIPFSLPFRYTY